MRRSPTDELVREKYRGIRPGAGLSGLPRSQPEADAVRPARHLARGQNKGPADITLTESFAMLPTAAVSGFYFAHPDASYFGVARIGPDQVADYAARRDVPIAQAERWLRPNLD